MKLQEFAAKGKVLKEKADSNHNYRFWTQDYFDEKVYISTQSLEDDKWYRVKITDNEVEVLEIIMINTISKFDFYI